jgi:adenine-specific DNA-methyltransferase
MAGAPFGHSRMKKFEAGDPGMDSRDPAAANLERMKRLFPDAWVEGAIDFAVLRQLLGGAVDDREEKYSLNWRGKREARQIALTPSTGTLRPAPHDSVDWDTTRNLMIEGDNLEVLKLLQKPYAGKVKAIYIDPPYNTGKDFVYPDDFRDSLRNYLELTGQTEDGRKISSNTEANGRFHSAWLSMMYPRLKLARDLLKNDGVMFVSVDEREFQNLRFICNELFGEECFAGALVVLSNPKGRSQDKYFATNHEYVVVYSKTVLPNGFFSIAKDEEQIAEEYPEEDDVGRFRALELRNTHREFGRHNRKNLFYPLFTDDEGNVSVDAGGGLHEVLPLWRDGYEGCWTWDRHKASAETALLEGRQVDGEWKIYRKSYASGADRMLKTILTDKSFFTERGQKEFNLLFDTREKLFQSPKSPYLIAQLLQCCTSGNDLILDFFAGSGTTGHAVMAQNAIDGNHRRYILVQFPEPLDPANSGQKAAADFCDSVGKPRSIAELTKERLRRAAAKITAASPDFADDRGFRSFRLDSSNLRAWDPAGADIEQLLLDSVAHLRADRSESDIRYELLLKQGVDLCAPMETRVIRSKTVYGLSDGTLLICLAESIAHADIEPLADGIAAWHAALAPAADVLCVFRDSAFDDDVAKVNFTSLLEQHGLKNIRSV